MERWAIEVQGLVQGVGFRPFVYRLATSRQLGGFVRNLTGGVRIEVEGPRAALEGFLRELIDHPPPLARIDRWSREDRPTRTEREFQIASSAHDERSPINISPDVATCPDCLAELCDPLDRRYRYPFLNCTNCGPRLTIIQGAPYDRSRTTMAGFTMCEACRQEYEDPSNRRFHAEPTACPACGPSLALLDARGQPIPCEDPIAQFSQSLLEGRIGALKGLGGYHLCCLAGEAAVVAELRRRKHRDEKPFAVMVPDIVTAARLATFDEAESALLRSAERPIVLLLRRPDAPVAESVAPGNPWLGLMLPYTPLHHLVMAAVDGVPLVMTSGNRSDEPIVYQDDAAERLAGIADLYLTHNRPIHVRCDDSVVRVLEGIPQPIRRSRGYAPRSIALPVACPRPILALGGQLKGTFALGRDRQAFLSHHMGDLDHFDAYRAFERDLALYQELFGITPEILVHDLHPDYHTTHLARRLAQDRGIPLLGVQHHHAHLASCLVENGLAERVIGVSFDGTGYGPDGAIWGGEFLVGDCRNFHRGAYLRYVPMPGGDRAIREPWRIALAHLADARLDHPLLQARLLPENLRLVRTMIQRRLHSPLTSSAGRLFDAVASLAGVRDTVSYEGQAAMELEWLASSVAADRAYPFTLGTAGSDAAREVDTRPLIAGVVEDVGRDVPPARIARRFHSALVELIATTCAWLRQETGIEKVVLSGGVFLNRLLTVEVSQRLGREGFQVYRHRHVPPNDGGLSLGQLAVAAASEGAR
jgi:hydrogenase maturation protein HypF